MTQRDDYVNKMKTQLDQWNAEIGRWEAKANEAQHAEAYRIRMAAYKQEQSRYAADRESYEQAMADWRRDVAACRAGDRSACQ